MRKIVKCFKFEVSRFKIFGKKAFKNYFMFEYQIESIDDN